MLQYLRARRLHLKIHANQDIFIDRDLFLNLGRVQNLSLDLRGSLPTPQLPVIVEEVKEDRQGNEIEESRVMRPTDMPLTIGVPDQLGNPVTSYSPNHPRAVFLEDLRIGNSAWDCSCDGIG